jgi:HSP20 family protein
MFNRFGDLFEREPLFNPASRAEWMPAVDIKETDEGYTFRMDVPGLKPEDLDVELHEGVLSIRGSRSDEKREEDEGYVRTERRQGSFSRQFRVPTTVPADSLEAEVKDGVLTIEVPKGAEQGARKVPVS